jgi:hypothetical protein
MGSILLGGLDSESKSKSKLQCIGTVTTSTKEVIQSNFQAGNTEQAFDGKPTPDFLRSPEKPKAINPR